MRVAAIIIMGLMISMALDGEYTAAPLWLSIAVALEYAHRRREARRTTHPDAQTDRIPLVGPRKRGQHG